MIKRSPFVELVSGLLLQGRRTNPENLGREGRVAHVNVVVGNYGFDQLRNHPTSLRNLSLRQSILFRAHQRYTELSGN